ncbi:peptidase domain-containing ABC transporter [Sphingomonas sp. GM_Shp_1]|uniref:peptidase domain-containing ABC transporter n=1 Tax=Sphingomonas sp. GM_Shp_1 TaxID=2937381 RepID=UPI00226B11C0|nr:peptidase domain-containing ABC transporter [Sphingomonas sp. GM_Shp_1]
MASILDLLDFGSPRKIPVVRQSEASECGLACLAMVMAYHGFEADMPLLRRQFGMGSRGATLKTLMDLADRLGLSARALRVDVDELGDVQTPAILHWSLNHFVVLTRVSKTWKGLRFFINDPARGSLTIGEGEFSRQFSGVALELVKTARFKPQRAKSPLKIGQLWSSLRGAGTTLAGVLMLSAILQLISLVMPFYLQLGIDTVLPTSDDQLLQILAIGFAGLALINMLTIWLRSIALLNTTNAFSFQVVNNLFRQLMSLPLAWFEKRHTGDVISRFGSIQPITDFVSQGMVSAVIDGIMASITLMLMFAYSPILAALALTAWVFYVAIKLGSFGAMRGANTSSITANARENSAFIETMRGISTIKSFGQEVSRQRVWQTLKANAVNASLKLGRITAGFDAISGFILALERVLFVYLAIKMAMKGTFTVGMIFAFQAYKQQFLDAASRLVDQGIRYRLIDVHLTRIADIALSRPEPAGLQRSSDRLIQGVIELRNVSFRYGVGDPFVLSNINLRIEAREMVAFVGPSGGGKTTLLKIMMGLLEPTAGVVLVDGQPLERVGLRAWRSTIGSVLQDDQLFAGSLAENIAFFEPEIDMDRVREVCRRAAVIDEIDAMPLGLETLVGDMGSSLSGGQRQRVMLARALYARPVVLFMDEGTANLDPAKEAEVVEAVRVTSVTRLIIAHRPLAIQAASRVFLVSDGRLMQVEARPNLGLAKPQSESVA